MRRKSKKRPAGLREVPRAEPTLKDRLRAGAELALQHAMGGPAQVAVASRAAWLRLRARRSLASRSGKLRLCLGSGAAPLPGWVNVDLDPRADLVLDLRFPLPFAGASAELIYSEHLIEHLTLEEGVRLLSECRRILLPGGVLRVATPDLAAVVTDYRRTWRDHDWLSWPEYQWVDTPARMVNTAFHAWGHRYLYDYEELALRLSGVGFEEVRRCSLGESDHPALAGLETRADSKLIVEAVAPGR